MTNMHFNYPSKTRTDFLQEVVSQLKSKRLKQQITQQELNHKLGMADFLVTKWENGIRTPLAYHLYCWADALDSQIIVLDKKVNLEHLLKLSEEMSEVANDNDSKLEK